MSRAAIAEAMAVGARQASTTAADTPPAMAATQPPARAAWVGRRSVPLHGTDLGTIQAAVGVGDAGPSRVRCGRP